MAFDAGFLRAVVYELNQKIIDAKVERIIQPAKDEVDFILHKFGQTYHLCIRGGNNLPRLSLTEYTKETLPTPPLFLILLRKHFNGAKILRIEQLGFERVAKITFLAYDELGYQTEKSLICEVMGKYSNVMATDHENKIMAVMRAVDFTTSRVRQVLPGMRYELPPQQDKYIPLNEPKEHFLSLMKEEPLDASVYKALLKHYLGTSIQVCHEIVYLATKNENATFADANLDTLYNVFHSWFEKLNENKYDPCMYFSKEQGVIDFSYAPLTYLEGSSEKKTFDTVSHCLDACYGEKEQDSRRHQRAQDLFMIVEKSIARLQRKMEAQLGELKDADKGEYYQRVGDLITANLYRMKRGDETLITEDYYEDPPKEITIELDSRLSPSSNAQHFYKLYNKAKHAKVFLTEQLEKSKLEIQYLETVIDSLNRSTKEQELLEIRDELYRAGYASKMKGYAPPKQVKTKPDTYTSPSGYLVYVGHNNIQNDYLTFHLAEKLDLWFHVKGVPGSHVILVCHGEEPNSEDYTYAATLAAIHSSVSGDMVAVDYTRVKNVKKPPQAKPGYVTYSTNYTAYVSTLGKKEDSNA